MATNNLSKNGHGQSYRLTKSGWASQNVLPFWLEDPQNPKSKPNEPAVTEDCLFAGGLNIRVPDNSESRLPVAEKVVQCVSHDHPYFKRPIAVPKRRKSKGAEGMDTLKGMDGMDTVDSLVMRALADVPKENIPRGEVSERTKNSQLYKYLMATSDESRRNGENFGHQMVHELVRSAFPLVKHGQGMTFRTVPQKQSMPTPVVTAPKPTFVPPPIPIPCYNIFEPKLPAPDFVDLHQKYWTVEQCYQYDMWWQQLPSCQYSR